MKMRVKDKPISVLRRLGFWAKAFFIVKRTERVFKKACIIRGEMVETANDERMLDPFFSYRGGRSQCCLVHHDDDRL